MDPDQEIFDVVDAHDQVIGRAPRAQVHAEGLRHRAAHILVFDPAGRLYVQRRAWTKDNAPGLWDTSAAGHLDSGEGYLAAAIRELAEELGVAPDAPLEALFKVEASNLTGQEFVWVYRATVSATITPDPGEIIDGRWCTADELDAWMARTPDDFTSTFTYLWRRIRPIQAWPGRWRGLAGTQSAPPRGPRAPNRRSSRFPLVLRIPVTAATPIAAREAIRAIQTGFDSAGYIASDAIATAVYLAQALTKPVIVEGPPGVGKTELATATAALLGKPLIRLQCYEGLDEAKALYEWKYGKQLLYTQVLKEKLGDLMQGAVGLKASIERLHEFDDTFFNEEFLEPRPLLKALWAKDGAVLLIDELDKSDQEFEAFLLELLQDYQISIPEIGTIKAIVPPMVFLTSNNTREIGDALKRRCLHLYIPFPDNTLEQRIIASRVPALAEDLRHQVVAFVQSLRGLDIKKAPAVSETIDWARTLVLLHATELEPEMVRATLNVLLKFQSDIELVGAETFSLVRQAQKA